MSPSLGLMALGRPETSTESGARWPRAGGRVLLSFERPAGVSPRLRPRRTLKTAQLAKQRNRRSASLACGAAVIGANHGLGRVALLFWREPVS